MCHCRIKQDCPFDGKCLTKAIVYNANVSTESESKSYIRACETEFKYRWNNYKSSFKHEHKRKQTTLSDHIWNLKNNNDEFSIKWSILKKSFPYSNVSKRCQLCLWEKYFIIRSDRSNTLNNRLELINKCRHSNKVLLKNYQLYYLQIY